MRGITRNKWFKRTILMLSSIMVVAVVAIPIAKANQPRDNDTNAIIYGGAYSIGELKNKLSNGTGQAHQNSAQLTHFYKTLGIDQDQFGKLENGAVYKNGKVTVGNSTVYTGAHSYGREFMPGSSKDDRFTYPIYWRPTSVSFASDSIPAFVYVNQDGSMAYAIIKSCGNPVKGVGVKIPNHRITVKKYNDLNGDGVRQGSESWLNGWTFHIKGPERDTTGTTKPYGEFDFINLKPGTYTITERQKDGWKCTSCDNGNLSVRVTGSTDEIVRFGNQKLEVNPTLYYCGTSADCISTTRYKDTSACQAGVEKPCYKTDTECKATAATYCPVPNPKLYFCSSSTACDSTISYKDTTTCQSGTGKPCYKTETECKATSATYCPVSKTVLYYCSTPSTCASTDSYNTTNECQAASGKPCYTSQSACLATSAIYCPVEKYQIRAKKFEDTNGSGTRESKEDWLLGWRIQLKGNNVSKDASTNNDGEVVFTGLSAGTYTVSEILQSSWKNVTPVLQTVTVNQNNREGYVEFGNQKIPTYPDKFTIVARKYEDIDGNTIRGNNEPWLQGWKIRLTGDKLTRDFVTNGEGEVTFKDLESGVYTISEEMQGGWKNITPTAQKANINKENPTAYIEFGNQQIPVTPPTIIQGVTSLPASGPIEVIAGTLATIGIGSAGVMYRRSRARLNKSFKKF